MIIAEDEIAITVVHHSQPTPRCSGCGRNQFGLARCRLICTNCGHRRQSSRGAIHLQAVVVDRAAWPLRNTVLHAIDYERLRKGLPVL